MLFKVLSRGFPAGLLEFFDDDTADRVAGTETADHAQVSTLKVIAILVKGDNRAR